MLAYLILGDGNGRIEDGPRDDFLTCRSGQRPEVAIEVQSVVGQQLLQANVRSQPHFLALFDDLLQLVQDRFQSAIILFSQLHLTLSTTTVKCTNMTFL